ncbi:MAG: potassium/proton antiporter [Nocardioidaceae bacterium]|nr:potassium/proton antiporter [Nocardioidaceae bacterium]
MDLEALDTFLLVGSGVLLAAILAVRLSVRAGLPSLLVYLGIGVVLGESVLGVSFSDADLAHALGFGALVLILAEGGLTTKWSEVRPSMSLGLLLATVGVTVSVAVVALGSHYLLGLEWQAAILLAAVTSPTDAAAVFSVLRRVPLTRSVLGTLEAESGLNDAPIVLLVTAVSTGAADDFPLPVFVAIVAVELFGGALIGFVVGRVGAWVMRGAALPSSGLYPIAVLALCVLAYGGTVFVHASGFAAVYVAALVLGNADLPHRAATRSFAEGIGWLAQIGLFVMLGLLVSPGLIKAEEVWIAIAAGALLTFVARPLSVLVCAVPLRVPWREQAFVSWAGLRGAVPIVLAAIPLAEDVPNATQLFNIVFVFVVVYTFVQAPSLGWAAGRLGVLDDGARDVEVDAAPLERVSADLLQVRVPPRSRLVGVEVGELRLPPGASVALVVRKGETSVPHRTFRIQLEDDLLVVAPRAVREQTEDRLRAVGRRGRLAGWLDPD